MYIYMYIYIYIYKYIYILYICIYIYTYKYIHEPVEDLVKNQNVKCLTIELLSLFFVAKADVIYFIGRSI